MGNFDDIPSVKTSFLKTKGNFDDIPKKMGLPFNAFALGGAPGFSLMPGSEDILPAAGQTVGGIGGFLGSVGGATTGELARQGIKALRGDASGIKKPLALSLGGVGIPQAIPSVGKEAISTATVEGIFRGAGKLLEPAANRLMLSVLKPARDVIKRNPNLGLEALNEGITGTKRQMLSKAENLISKAEPKIQALIKGNNKKVFLPNILKSIDEIKRPFANVGDQASIDAIDELQKVLREKMSFGQQGYIGLEEANQLKRDLYAVLKSSQYGKGIGEVPVKATARKMAAYGLKKEIEGAVPAVKKLNKSQAIGIEASNALENRLASEARNVILPKLAGMGAGGVALSGHPMAGLGILAGDKLVDLMRSAPIISGFAKNLTRSKSLGRPLTIAASEILRRLTSQQ